MAIPTCRGKMLHSQSIAYSATTLGSALMGSIFNTYYVKVYLEKFHVSESWFHISQIVFMIWNAVNDPLFGYIQDNFSFSWVKTRRHSILYGAPLFVLSFLLPWIPWGDYSQPTALAGIQLMVSLCFYDTWFTFVLLAQCALFTEISQKSDDRIRLIKYSQIASMIGSNAVLITGLVSTNMEDYGLFFACCLFAGLLALVSMIYTGLYADSHYDTAKTDTLLNLNESTSKLSPAAPGIEYSVWQQMWQIAKQRNFVSFVFTNLCQIFQKSYLYSFVVIVCDSLISKDELSSSARSTFYGSLHIIPHLLTLVATGTSFVKSYGYYDVIRKSFFLKISLGIGLYIIGCHTWSIIIFFIISTAECSAVFNLFNLPLSDIIDIDTRMYRRKSPLSSLVYGTNALITKPAQSFAPMAAVAIFKRYGYDTIHTAHSTTQTDWSAPEFHQLQHAMFLFTCATPVLVGILQWFVWSFYQVSRQTNTDSVAKTIGTSMKTI